MFRLGGAFYLSALVAIFALWYCTEPADALCCDNDNWGWVKKACCVGSCMGQNCGTGDCSGRTCMCRRCENGPSVQVGVGKGKK